MADFPCRLKQLRLEHALTQQELADILDVSQNAIYNWENGKRQPRLEQLRKIAEVFNFPLYELLNDLVNFWDTMSQEEIEKDLESSPIKKKKDTLLDNLIPGNILSVSDVQEQKMLSDYRQLNANGKTEAIKRVQELTEIPRYTDKDTK